MQIDIQWLRDNFRAFNARYFDGVLPEPRFYIGRSKTRLGSLSYKRGLVWGRKSFFRSGIVMRGKGEAFMGIGEGKGENMAVDAITNALCNKVQENTDITGATGIILNITSGPDFTMPDLQKILNLVRSNADENVNLIFGHRNALFFGFLQNKLCPMALTFCENKGSLSSFYIFKRYSLFLCF